MSPFGIVLSKENAIPTSPRFLLRSEEKGMSTIVSRVLDKNFARRNFKSKVTYQSSCFSVTKKTLLLKERFATSALKDSLLSDLTAFVCDFFCLYESSVYEMLGYSLLKLLKSLQKESKFFGILKSIKDETRYENDKEALVSKLSKSQMVSFK